MSLLDSDALAVYGKLADSLIEHVGHMTTRREMIFIERERLRQIDAALAEESRKMLATADVLTEIVRKAHLECQEPMQQPEATDG